MDDLLDDLDELDDDDVNDILDEWNEEDERVQRNQQYANKDNNRRADKNLTVRVGQFCSSFFTCDCCCDEDGLSEVIVCSVIWSQKFF